MTLGDDQEGQVTLRPKKWQGNQNDKEPTTLIIKIPSQII